MKLILLSLILCLAPSCKSASPAEILDEHRVDLYRAVDAVRAIDPQLADQLLAELVKLELLADAISAADPSD